MAEKTAGNDVCKVDLSKIIAAGLGHQEALSEKELQEFDALLDAPHLNEQERQEFLQTVWNIIVACIDFGWGDHPIQQVQDSCGKSPEIKPDSGLSGDNMVFSEDRKLNDKYNKVAE